MKLAIVGTRTFNNAALMDSSIAGLVQQHGNITEIISGGARGADRLAEQYAHQHAIPLTIFYPDWYAHGLKAGPMRNTRIVQAADHVLAFWDYNSRGTMDTINKAVAANKPVTIVHTRTGLTEMVGEG
jgi:hypothetical protein